jgi:hypothetical protein
MSSPRRETADLINVLISPTCSGRAECVRMEYYDLLGADYIFFATLGVFHSVMNPAS